MSMKFYNFLDVSFDNGLLLLTKIFPYKVRENISAHIDKTNRITKGVKQGFAEGSAIDSFGYVYSGYTAILSFILLGISWKVRGLRMDVFNYILVVTPILIGYIPAYKAVFSHDKYENYIKLFSKESKQWHRNWMRITVLFIFCGTLGATVLGILLVLNIYHS